jgi:hypothetical protein
MATERSSGVPTAVGPLPRRHMPTPASSKLKPSGRKQKPTTALGSSPIVADESVASYEIRGDITRDSATCRTSVERQLLTVSEHLFDEAGLT